MKCMCSRIFFGLSETIHAVFFQVQSEFSGNTFEAFLETGFVRFLDDNLKEQSNFVVREDRVKVQQ